ncbi:NADP-reducing hydrogenase subunit HndA [wastewater metagenome]|uniref:NADP-reducing hydrogenase subunit HndA n=2 Tax=unclassified sequences TaxID=12908 RepID=A0A5B8RFF1_9ZZZZ|nr:NADP-reducing hydrogenase subunit HndA [uncultured organism]
MTTEESDGALPSTIESICRRHGGREGPLLAILHDVQDTFGHIPDEAVRHIARTLNLTRAEVHGVVRFYTDFHAEPARAHQLKVCRAEACQAVGGRAVWAAAQALSAVPDGRVEIEPVYCLGNCPCGPSAQWNGRTLGRMTPERVHELVAAAEGGRPS